MCVVLPKLVLYHCLCNWYYLKMYPPISDMQQPFCSFPPFMCIDAVDFHAQRLCGNLFTKTQDGIFVPLQPWITQIWWLLISLARSVWWLWKIHNLWEVNFLVLWQVNFCYWNLDMAHYLYDGVLGFTGSFLHLRSESQGSS
jgi:hypothetical protein